MGGGGDDDDDDDDRRGLELGMCFDEEEDLLYPFRPFSVFFC